MFSETSKFVYIDEIGQIFNNHVNLLLKTMKNHLKILGSLNEIVQNGGRYLAPITCKSDATDLLKSRTTGRWIW